MFSLFSRKFKSLKKPLVFPISASSRLLFLCKVDRMCVLFSQSFCFTLNLDEDVFHMRIKAPFRLAGWSWWDGRQVFFPEAGFSCSWTQLFSHPHTSACLRWSENPSVFYWECKVHADTLLYFYTCEVHYGHTSFPKTLKKYKSLPKDVTDIQ